MHRGAIPTRTIYTKHTSHLTGGYGNAGMRPERRSAAGMKGGTQPPLRPFWRRSVKSREREGSALAVNALRSL
jgi:hypothetical protein